MMLIIVDVAGVAAGIGSLARGSMGAAVASAALGLMTMLMAIGMHGYAMMRAFDDVARQPPESKQVFLAEAIADAMWNLPIGAGLAGSSVVLSTMSWLLIRHRRLADEQGSPVRGS